MTGVENRVAVVGLGTVNPLGNDVPTTWGAIQRGANGVTKLAVPFRDRIFVGGEVTDFDGLALLDRKQRRGAHRAQQFSVAGVYQALNDADMLSGMDLKGIKPEEIGTQIGTGIGGVLHVEEVLRAIAAGDPIDPYAALMIEPERVATLPSMVFKLRGPLGCELAACATGVYNIEAAYQVIKRGDAEAMVTGSAEAINHPVTYAIYDVLKALSNKRDPERASIPFDKDRDGFVASEGVGILVLENMARAKARGVRIYGEIVGTARTADAFSPTAPSGYGAQDAMSIALERAHLKPEEIDHVDAHGTGTIEGDRKELESIKIVLGEHADKVPISSLKSLTGHLVGGAGAIETLVDMLKIWHGVITPNRGLEKSIAPEMDLVRGPVRHQRVRTVLKNSFGFGGLNGVLALQEDS